MDDAGRSHEVGTTCVSKWDQVPTQAGSLAHPLTRMVLTKAARGQYHLRQQVGSDANSGWILGTSAYADGTDKARMRSVPPASAGGIRCQLRLDLWPIRLRGWY